MNGIKVIAENKRQGLNILFLTLTGPGIVLNGDEVKSIRQGAVNLKTALP